MAYVVVAEPLGGIACRHCRGGGIVDVGGGLGKFAEGIGADHAHGACALHARFAVVVVESVARGADQCGLGAVD